eukprot:snap_masked-scaffold310_size212938-processed-gene-1.12 protein:Tk03979 transcript:snap_masked-scaffold310_size212938-processed-gene-1.12-mRNA-1 annotation:"hypothetical protein G5I_05342"
MEQPSVWVIQQIRSIFFQSDSQLVEHFQNGDEGSHHSSVSARAALVLSARASIHGLRFPDFDSRTSIPGLRFPDFDSRTSTPGLRFPDFDSRTSIPGLRFPDFDSRTSIPGLRFPDFDSRTSIPGLRFPDFDSRTSIPGLRFPDFDSRTSIPGLPQFTATSGVHSQLLLASFERLNWTDLWSFLEGFSSPPTSSGTSNSLVGSSLVYQSGETAFLPCDISVPNESKGDELSLIMWYREDVKSPIYSIDARTGVHIPTVNDVRSHWIDTNLFGHNRVVFDTSPGPERSRLKIYNVSETDDGLYRCRVDFKASQTRTSRVNLTVIGTGQFASHWKFFIDQSKASPRSVRL